MKFLQVSIYPLLVACIIGCATGEDHLRQAGEGVFIHVTHGPDDPHRVLMALNMLPIPLPPKLR